MILLIGFILLGLGTALSIYLGISQGTTEREMFPMGSYTLPSLLMTIGLVLIFISVVFIV